MPTAGREPSAGVAQEHVSSMGPASQLNDVTAATRTWRTRSAVLLRGGVGDAREDMGGATDASGLIMGAANQPPHRFASVGSRYGAEIRIRHKRVLASVVRQLNSLL